MMRRELDYQPMGPPPSTTTHEQMQAKLSARVAAVKVNGGIGDSASVEAPSEVPLAPATSIPPPTLEWEKPRKDATGLKTACGRYSCAKVTVNGKTTYELWRLVPGHWFRQIAIGQESFAKVKELAQIDVNKVPT